MQNPDAAALTMHLRDYDFRLFTEDDTETESVVYRGGPTGYGLIRTADTDHPVTFIPLTVHPQRAPMLPVSKAIELLNKVPSQLFLFFADSRTGRGRVLYRRYDGHLGLITPG